MIQSFCYMGELDFTKIFVINNNEVFSLLFLFKQIKQQQNVSDFNKKQRDHPVLDFMSCEHYVMTELKL